MSAALKHGIRKRNHANGNKKENGKRNQISMIEN